MGTYSKRFEQKKAVMFGDSIVAFDHTMDEQGNLLLGYEYWLKRLLGFREVENAGLPGYPFAHNPVTGEGIGEYIQKNYQSTDLVLIAAGTNDFRLDVPLGTVSDTQDFDIETTAGALRVALQRILTVNPAQKCVLMTPLMRDNSGYSITSFNQVGYQLKDYRGVTLELGEQYNIPVWDGYFQSGITIANLKTHARDGLHPNNAGYAVASESLAELISSVEY
jgi:lysophospholipase L1-like esterase